MTYAERILNALTDDWQTGPDIARKIGIEPCTCIAKLRVLEKYRLVERGELVRNCRNGYMMPTWRRIQ